MFFVGYWINVVVHETGHFLGGCLSGYKLIKLSFLLFAIEKRKQQYTFVSSQGPQTIMYPASKNETRYLLYNAGGFILDLVFVLACTAIMSETSGLIKFLFIQIDAFGFVSLAINSIPDYSDGHPNDGWTIRLLLKSQAARNDFLQYLNLYRLIWNNEKINTDDYQYKRIKEGKYDSLIFYDEIKKLLEEYNKKEPDLTVNSDQQPLC